MSASMKQMPALPSQPTSIPRHRLGQGFRRLRLCGSARFWTSVRGTSLLSPAQSCMVTSLYSKPLAAHQATNGSISPSLTPVYT